MSFQEYQEIAFPLALFSIVTTAAYAANLIPSVRVRLNARRGLRASQVVAAALSVCLTAGVLVWLTFGGPAGS